MNTTNILLGTTSLLLVVAFALSFGDFNKNRNSASANKEYEEIRAELAAQKALFDKMQLENLRSSAITTPVPAPIAPSPAPTEIAPLSEDLKSKLEAEIAKLKDEKDKAELKADTNEKETLILMGEKTKAAQRQERDAQRVTNALLMGNVSAFKKDWAWLSFSPTDSANFQPGQELGIRRNSGILGRITIDRLEGDQYVANVKENAYAGGIPDIVEGDEIIVIPPFYGVSGE
jgi:hypothetical protein